MFRRINVTNYQKLNFLSTGFQRQSTPNGQNGNGNTVPDNISPVLNDSSESYKYGNQKLTTPYKQFCSCFISTLLQEDSMQVPYTLHTLSSKPRYKNLTTKLERSRSMNIW